MSNISYKITLFDWNLNLKWNLNLREFSSIWSFSAQENWWLWDLQLEVKKTIWEDRLNYWDIIEIKKNKQVIYTWTILNVARVIDEKWEYLKIKLVWLFWLLKTCLVTKDYNDTASNIIKDLIDLFNQEYWTNIFLYSSSTIEDTTTNINISFSKKDYLYCINEIVKTSWLKLYIWADRNVYFKSRWTEPNHRLAVWREIINITRESLWEDICNSLILKYNWWEKVYEDLNTTYPKREKYIDKSSEINDVQTADEYWNEYIEKYKEIIKKTSIIVWNDYNFFDIKPLDLIKIKNFWENIWLLQVSRVSYSTREARIDLEKYNSLWEIIFDK